MDGDLVPLVPERKISPQQQLFIFHFNEIPAQLWNHFSDYAFDKTILAFADITGASGHAIQSFYAYGSLEGALESAKIELYYFLGVSYIEPAGDHQWWAVFFDLF